MVKFTIASIFFILTALSAVVFATPTSPAYYSVQVRGTPYFLFSDGSEKPGDSIAVTQINNPATTRVLIDLRPVGRFPSMVMGKAGLYAAMGKDNLGQPTLIWDTASKAYPWSFTTITPQLNYQISTPGLGPIFWFRNGMKLAIEPASGDTFTIVHF